VTGPGDPCPFCPGRFNEDLVCETCWTYVPNGQAVSRSKYPELFKVLGQQATFGHEETIVRSSFLATTAYGYCDLPASHPARSVAVDPHPLQVWEIALVCHVCHKGAPDHEPNCLLNSEHVQYVGRHCG